jgi:hypothetical protein
MYNSNFHSFWPGHDLHANVYCLSGNLLYFLIDMEDLRDATTTQYGLPLMQRLCCIEFTAAHFEFVTQPVFFHQSTNLRSLAPYL